MATGNTDPADHSDHAAASLDNKEARRVSELLFCATGMRSGASSFLRLARLIPYRGDGVADFANDFASSHLADAEFFRSVIRDDRVPRTLCGVTFQEL
jgi:hypothetical protein